MSDTLAGRRVLEHFGLLAMAPAASKKQEKARSPFEHLRSVKATAVDRPRQSK